MPITIPKTWGSEVLNASDVNANINAIKEGAARTDSTWWSSGKFVDTEHIVKPYIQSTQNASHQVSGWYCSQTSGALYTSGSFVSKFEADVDDKMIIPKTSITIPVMKPASVFYQFWSCSESRTDQDGVRGTLVWNVYYTDKDNTSLQRRQLQQEQIYDSGLSQNGSIISGREFLVLNGAQTIGPTVSNLVVGVSGYPNSSNASAQLLSWGFTVECFYI